jgi:hypothetical protein
LPWIFSKIRRTLFVVDFLKRSKATNIKRLEDMGGMGLPGTDYTVTESGWSNADVSEEYMKKIISLSMYM